MLSTVLLFLFVLITSICSSSITNYNYYFNSKSNDSFYQDDQQNPVNINYYVYNIYGKDVDIKKLLNLNDVKTVEPVLNVNNTNQVNTTTIQNKDKEVEKVRDDYTLYPGHGYYKYHNNEVTWYHAKHICEQEGAHLVVINSQAEADLLIGIKKTNNYTNAIFVGFYRISTYSDYVTVLGGRLNDTGYNKWYSGYPTTASGHDCGWMTTDCTLFNHPCTSFNRPFICEI